MNIDEMPAGHEMDALVAEHVMGWTEVHQDPDGEWCGKCAALGESKWWIARGEWEGNRRRMEPWPYWTLRNYSTRVDHAWLVVEMAFIGVTPTKDKGYLAQVRRSPLDRAWCGEGYWPDFGSNRRFSRAYGETAALAICRAALKAVMS